MKDLPTKLVNLTKRQIQYLKDEVHRFYVNCAGRRARKTLISIQKIVWGKRGAVMNRDQNYFLAAPTRRQAKRILWDRLKKDTKCVWKRKPNESELYIELLSGSKIYVEGLDKPDRIEGLIGGWHGCHITEFANIKEAAWFSNIFPALSDTHGFAILDSVPEGRNHYYDRALYACGGVIPESLPIKGIIGVNPDDPAWVYYHWFSSDVLDKAEIYQARMNMDERTFQQEYEGQFIGYAGLAYYCFTGDNLNLELERSDKEIIHIGMDFNVNPMTATLNHIRSDDIFQWGEIYLSNSNTFEMRDYLKQRYPIDQCVIYPDSTGASEHSNATRSDLAILRSAGFEVKARKANPRVIDRVNAVNSKHKSGDGKPHYFINPKNCPKTMNDWNKIERLDDGRLDKKQEDSGLKHISDAEGYLINFLFPIQRSIASSAQA